MAFAGGRVLLFATQSALAEEAASKPNIFPPWQHGENNDAIDRGVEFTVPQIDDLADFHGDLSDPKLVLYVGGNYFFAMARSCERSRPLIPSIGGASTGRRSRPVCSLSS